MKRKTIYFTAPRQVELREEPLPDLGADDVLVETICSAISAGTESLVYQNRFPRDVETDSVISGLRGAFEYPLAYGYACVGVVRETGKQVDKSWQDKIVFSFQPHTSHFIAKPDSLFPIPESISQEAACFLPNMETAVNLVQDAAPILGERVLVLGQGIVGLLVSALLKEFPLESLVTSDRFELRRKASLAIGVDDSFKPVSMKDNESFPLDDNSVQSDINQQSVTRTHPKSQSGYTQNFDLTFELTGSPSALDDAIAMTTFSGRIVIGSWYGDKRAPIDLGGAFHRSRIKLISSQVSTIAPELSGRWDKARRFNVAWEALRRIQPQKWITHRFPIEDAQDAYRLLDENPQETIQVVFDYRD
ncbi:MAG: zinc-binding alcohol dehydrogenase [Anaerolineales bacterium]|nr:zinc-binding alcohol dehydrogenase [Anaerolineales bacterium]